MFNRHVVQQQQSFFHPHHGSNYVGEKTQKSSPNPPKVSLHLILPLAKSFLLSSGWCMLLARSRDFLAPKELSVHMLNPSLLRGSGGEGGARQGGDEGPRNRQHHAGPGTSPPVANNE